ncbi:S-layer homology domain-containing protein [Brevibacillus sp. TJ4]|uniref:S-layer homology domain-containing protein n=1 Tax=Brevibacillus sp. TJ4 TaxID=3234853 RepID=UPI0037D562DA
MKKWMILASLAVSLLAGTWTAQADANEFEKQAIPYTDISGHWAEKEIRELYIHGALGQSDSFRPNDPVTRQELITMFLRAKGIQPTASGTSSFADVEAGSWLAPYAETAYRLGLIHGQKNGGKVWFRPDDPIKREELVSILIRARGESGAVNNLKWSATVQALAGYGDGDEVGQPYQRPFVYALQHKLVQPYSDQTLKPQQNMTRAEAATYAALHLLQKQSGGPQLADLGVPYRQALTVQTTAYSYPADQPILSYLEYPLRVGVVAVDPTVIPLGSHLYIEGYGYAVAADIGGAVKQNKVDLYLPTKAAAVQHGIQQGVQVYVLE